LIEIEKIIMKNILNVRLIEILADTSFTKCSFLPGNYRRKKSLTNRFLLLPINFRASERCAKIAAAHLSFIPAKGKMNLVFRASGVDALEAFQNQKR